MIKDSKKNVNIAIIHMIVAYVGMFGGFALIKSDIGNGELSLIYFVFILISAITYIMFIVTQIQLIIAFKKERAELQNEIDYETEDEVRKYELKQALEALETEKHKARILGWIILIVGAIALLLGIFPILFVILVAICLSPFAGVG